MLQYLTILTKRPSDKQVKLIKIIFGIILVLTTYFNLFIQGDAIENNWFGYVFSENLMQYAKYDYLFLSALPLISGLLPKELVKSKYTRMLQIAYGIILIYFGTKIVESPELEIDTLYSLFGFFSILAGVTGKLITKKGLKVGQKVTKIRV